MITNAYPFFSFLYRVVDNVMRCPVGPKLALTGERNTIDMTDQNIIDKLPCCYFDSCVSLTLIYIVLIIPSLTVHVFLQVCLSLMSP